jgi:hypothetical protein
MKALFEKNSIEVVERIEPDLPKIKADGPQLREVVSNPDRQCRAGDGYQRSPDCLRAP